jgi:hypothetical protein
VLVATIVLSVLLLAVAPLLTIALRRRALQRGGGTIELSLLLKPAQPGAGWVLGIGRFEGDCLEWYRVFSLAPRPRRTLSRRHLTVCAQRPPQGAERHALLAGAVVMECREGREAVSLAMDPSAVTGFLAWLEARPPGATLPA